MQALGQQFSTARGSQGRAQCPTTQNWAYNKSTEVYGAVLTTSKCLCDYSVA